MITASFILIGKIILLIVIIGAMVMILLGITHLFHNDDLNSKEDDLILRDELEKSEDVVSEKSVFYNFLINSEREDNNNKRNKGKI